MAKKPKTEPLTSPIRPTPSRIVGRSRKYGIFEVVAPPKGNPVPLVQVQIVEVGNEAATILRDMHIGACLGSWVSVMGDDDVSYEVDGRYIFYTFEPNKIVSVKK